MYFSFLLYIWARKHSNPSTTYQNINRSLTNMCSTNVHLWILVWTPKMLYIKSYISRFDPETDYYEAYFFTIIQLFSSIILYAWQ